MGFFSNDPADPARHDRGVGVQLQVEEPGLVDPPVREHRAARRRVGVDPDLAADAEQSRGREEHLRLLPRSAARVVEEEAKANLGSLTADLKASKKCATRV